MTYLKSKIGMRHKQIGFIFVREQGLDLEVWDGGAFPRWSMGVVSTEPDGQKPDNVAGIPKAQKWLVVLPTYLCTTRYIQLPASRREEIAAMLEFEVPQLTPCNTQSWTWDFCVTNVQEDGTSQVLVVLSPLLIVESALEKVHRLGIEPDLVTISAALWAMSPTRGHDRGASECYGYLRWDCGSLDFSAMNGSRLVFLRGVRICGQNLHAIDCAEAEVGRSLSLLRERGLDNGELSIRVGGADPEISSLIERLRQSSRTHTDQRYAWEAYDETLVGGTTVSLWRNARTCIPCLNLLPRSRKAKDRRARRRREFLAMGLRLCVVALLMLLCVRMSLWRQRRLLQQYQQRITKIAPLAQKLQFLQGQLHMIQTQVHGSVSMLDIISELYEVLPQDVTIHYLSIDQNREVVVRAQARWLSQAFESIEPLEQSAALADVRQSYAHLRELEGQILIDFELRADLEKRTVKQAKP